MIQGSVFTHFNVSVNFFKIFKFYSNFYQSFSTTSPLNFVARALVHLDTFLFH